MRLTARVEQIEANTRQYDKEDNHRRTEEGVLALGRSNPLPQGGPTHGGGSGWKQAPV